MSLPIKADVLVNCVPAKHAVPRVAAKANRGGNCSWTGLVVSAVVAIVLQSGWEVGLLNLGQSRSSSTNFIQRPPRSRPAAPIPLRSARRDILQPPPQPTIDPSSRPETRRWTGCWGLFRAGSTSHAEPSLERATPLENGDCRTTNFADSSGTRSRRSCRDGHARGMIERFIVGLATSGHGTRRGLVFRPAFSRLMPAEHRANLRRSTACRSCLWNELACGTNLPAERVAGRQGPISPSCS